jgi:hypothetical protein
VEGGVVGEEGRELGIGFRDIWRRRKGSLGSVRETLRVRDVLGTDALVSGLGGGRRDERRIGGAANWVKLDHCDRRLGDEELGGDEMDADSLHNFGRSVEP